MILAAGLGTRLKPFTDKHPKALAFVNGKSILQRNIEYLQSEGIKNVIVNVHHFADQVTEAIEINKGWGSNITISNEINEVLETGGGLKKAAWFFEDEENLILLNTDILTDLSLQEMIQQHLKHQPLATLATTTRETSRYFLFNDDGILCGWRNVKTGEEKVSRPSKVYHAKAFSGLYVINTRLLPMMHWQGKFSMVDVYLEISKSNDIMFYDHSHSKFIDVGKPESIAIAESLFV